MTAPGREFESSEIPETVTGLLVAADLKRGDLIADRFRVEKLLGMGGMGVVYLAHDQKLGVDVALKLLRPELASRPDAFERFRQELLLARQVSSPHVVRIHDLVQHGDVWLLSMDYVPGRSLQQLLDDEGVLEPDRAIAIARQLALGLAAAHQRGVIHRDLKPANVLVTENDEALITDFGVARSVGATGITLSGVIVGTPEYLSPEQARAEKVDARSDLYALGLILHEMLTLRVPFAGGTPAELLAQRIVSSPPAVDSVKPGLPGLAVALCSRLLELRPARRFADAMAVVSAIDAGRVPRSAPSARPMLALLLIAGLVAIVLGASIFWMRSRTASEPTSAGVAEIPMALAVLPARLPTDPDAGAELIGAERQLSLRLIEAGVAAIDPMRLDRTMRELDISRGQVERQRPRLLQSLRVREFILMQLVTQPEGPVLTLSLHDAESGAISWSATYSGSETQGIERLLSQAWGDLAPRVGAGPLVAPFSGSVQLQRIAALSPLDGAGSLDATTLTDGWSEDEWWWALETLEREGRFADSSVLAREALKAIESGETGRSDRLKSLASYLAGDVDEALQLLDSLTLRPTDPLLQLLRARVLIASGRYDDAIALLREAVAHDDRNVDAWYQLGKALLMKGEAQVAVDDALTRAMVVANRQEDRRMQADIGNALGIGYRQLGQLEPAAREFVRATSLRAELGDKRGEGASLRNLAAVRSIQGRFDDADVALQQARAIIESLGDPAALADLANDVGLLAEERGDFRAALDAYREALGFRQTSGDPGWIAESLVDVGFAYYQLGEFDTAQVFLQQAAQAHTSIDDRAGAIRAEQGLGLSEMARGNFERAREIVELSLRDAEDLQMREEQSTALAALSELDRLQGHYEQSLARAGSAAVMYEQRGELRGTIEMKLLRAAALLDIGDHESAIAALAGLDPAEVVNREQRALLQVRLATAALQRGAADEALTLAEQALATASASGAALPEISAQSIKARALARLGRTSQARETLVEAERGLVRFASVPLRLEVLESRLESDPSAASTYSDARTLLARVPSYGREWRIALLAGGSAIAEPDRREAMHRFETASARVSEALDASHSALFTEWVKREAKRGEKRE